MSSKIFEKLKLFRHIINNLASFDTNKIKNLESLDISSSIIDTIKNIYISKYLKEYLIHLTELKENHKFIRHNIHGNGIVNISCFNQKFIYNIQQAYSSQLESKLINKEIVNLMYMIIKEGLKEGLNIKKRNFMSSTNLVLINPSTTKNIKSTKSRPGHFIIDSLGSTKKSKPNFMPFNKLFDKSNKKTIKLIPIKIQKHYSVPKILRKTKSQGNFLHLNHKKGQSIVELYKSLDKNYDYSNYFFCHQLLKQNEY